jgi:2-polyprenyl-3-methyl-5-hydroxy-6-metoxy-1,4-benzoquinol methylase
MENKSELIIDNYKLLQNCLCCKSKNIQLLFDLENQPLANDFHSINYTCNLYPLQLMICLTCFHTQLSNIVNPQILFKNYKYLSGTSQTGITFFKNNANYINDYMNKKYENDLTNFNKKILDIACNDGTQLNFFKELGWKTYGIDPATNLYDISTKNEHYIVCDYWNIESSKKFDTMDVIIAQNVFAHTEYVDNFLQACKNIMSEKSSLFIQTSQKNMILNGEFDTIYHEHLSFFNTKSMNILVNRNGLVLNQVIENDIHGKSYIFEINLIKNNEIYNVDKYIENEEKLGLYDMKLYNNFKINSINTIVQLKYKIRYYKNNGYKCIGGGAAAKGQTVLCYGKIYLDYIIDENPLKIGLYSAKMNIPIVSIEHFKNDTSENFLVIILAWNFSNEIKEKIKCIQKNNIVIIDNYFINN